MAANRLTGVRREVKYLLDSEKAKNAYEQLSKRVAPKIVDGASRNYRVSIYLDTEDKSFSRAELKNSEKSTKMRVKEYYQLENASPLLSDLSWLEVKIRAGQMVEKSRFAVANGAIADCLSRGPAPMVDSKDQAACEAFEMTRAGNPLIPIVVVHYRRATLQDKDAKLRITFDDQITFHVPPRDLISDRLPCTRGSLPPPLLVEPRFVVEVKSLGAVPIWVEDVLGGHNQVAYSKFHTGVKELERYGLLSDVSQGGQ